MKSEAKTNNAELARLQAFLLDPVCPLVKMLHSLDEEGYTIEETRSDLTEALRLLGNASSQISHACNPDIQDLVGEELFWAAAPNLFGEGFEQKMKDQAESMKLIAKAKAPPPKKFF